MIHKAMIIYEKNLSILMIIVLCLSNLILLGVNAETQITMSQPPPIEITQDKIPLFGGINSIRATIGESTIGVLYGSSENPQPLYLFTEFSQKIAKIKIYNRRGTLENEIELRVQNTFIFRLDSIIEFSDRNDDTLYNFIHDRIPIKMLNLSSVSFYVSKSNDFTNDSENAINYMINFTASDISYQRISGIPLTSSLDHLCFSFKLRINRDQVTINEVPEISIQPQALGYQVSRTTSNISLQANRLTPRLKFSCNITGWDFSSQESKILLKTTMITHEQILTQFGKISGSQITRDALKSTDIFSRLIFNVKNDGQSRQFNLDHNENRTKEYSTERLTNFRITLGNTLRNFLNLTWLPDVKADGIDNSIVFQLFASGEANFPLRALNPLVGLYLIGGFIFPQGHEIYYDPEVQFEELNPIFSIPQIPNRSILEENSSLILVSGFLIGILIIFRQITYRRRY